MPEPQPAKYLRLHVGEDERWNGKPLYEAVVEKCRELEISGVSVFRGVEGFGESAEMHQSHLITRDRPILISIVETEENLARLLPEIEGILDTAMMAISDVQMIRICKSTLPH